jgi:topoisomerase-4 subunit A
MDCSDIDDIIVFRSNGVCVVTKVQDKVFVGKDIIYCSVFKKNDDRKVYNLTYLDGKSGQSYVKRFKVTAVTRDREYKLTGTDNKSKITYFSANENGEAEIIQVSLTANCKAKIKQFDYDFKNLAIKGRESMGNLLTKYPVRKIILKSAGISTLGGVDIWYDATIGRLNRDEHGVHIGNFEPKDLILVMYKNGQYELTNFELTNRYAADEVQFLNKFNPNAILSAAYFDGASKVHMIKRFKIETSTVDKKFHFITEHKMSKLLAVTDNYAPDVQIKSKPDGKTNEITLVPIDELVEVRGWKAIGNKLNFQKLSEVEFIPTEVATPEEEIDEPEFVITNLENEVEEVKEVEVKETTELPVVEKEEIPFEIKNLPNDSEKHGSGEQLGLF